MAIEWGRPTPRIRRQHRPDPQSKRHRPNATPADLVERLAPLGTLRAKALLRQAFGELGDASSVLERIADALRLLDETEPDQMDTPTAEA